MTVDETREAALTVTKEGLVAGAIDPEVRRAMEALPEPFVLKFFVEAEGEAAFSTSGTWPNIDGADRD